MIDISKYDPQIQAAGLQLYQPNINQDILLMRLWLDLFESGELLNLLPSGSHPLSRFLKLFQSPAITIYCVDQKGIWLIAWFTPTAEASKAAFCSYWARAEKRGTKQWLNTTKLIYTIALDIWESLFGITHQPKLFDIHKKFGYNIIGTANGLLEYEKSGFIVQLTKESFMNSQAYKIGE